MERDNNLYSRQQGKHRQQASAAAAVSEMKISFALEFARVDFQLSAASTRCVCAMPAIFHVSLRGMCASKGSKC